MRTKLKRSPADSRAGFTLIELMVALAALGIIWQVLPAVQKAREAANRSAAEVELKTLAASIAARGSMPVSLADIAAGKDAKNGYRLSAVEMTPQRVRIAAEPIPGVTGSQTGLLEITPGPAGLSARVQFAPTPGADEGRRRMMNEAVSVVADQFGRLAGWAMQDFHFRALDSVREEIDSTAQQQQVFSSLKGTDGKVSFASIDAWARGSQSEFRDIYNSMWWGVAAAMQLGAQGENVAALPGLSSLPAVQHPDKLLNFAVLGELTTRHVLDATLRAKLLNFVYAAQSADKAGNAAGRKAALDLYTNELTNVEARAFSWGMSGGLAGAPNSFVAFLKSDGMKAVAEAMK